MVRASNLRLMPDPVKFLLCSFFVIKLQVGSDLETLKNLKKIHLGRKGGSGRQIQDLS